MLFRFDDVAIVQCKNVGGNRGQNMAAVQSASRRETRRLGSI
jgi:hypothetical protein